MRRFVLDTNVLLHAVRNSKFWQQTEKKYNLLQAENKIFISVASCAEILSLARQLNWGEKKMQALNSIFQALTILYINQNVINNYVEIDVYSQGKHLQHKLPKGISARNMGKNDIWIAATTRSSKAILLSTDNDFSHLNKILINFEYLKNT